MISGLKTGWGFVWGFLPSESLVLLSERYTSHERMVRTEKGKPRSINAASYNYYTWVRIASDTEGCSTLPIIRIFQFYSQSWNKPLSDPSHFSSLVFFFLLAICGSFLKSVVLPTILYRRLLWGLGGFLKGLWRSWYTEKHMGEVFHVVGPELS